MRKQKRDGKHSLLKNNLIQDSEGSEEIGYPVPDSNKTKKNDAKGPINAHKNIIKEEILQVITENFMEMLVDTVNKRHSRNSKTPKIKNMRRHRNE
jgi:hypothetical protein